MRKVLIPLVSCILLISMMLSLCSCSSTKSEIKSLMGNFEEACNDLDFNAVLDCITPTVSDSIKLGAGLVGMFTKMDSDEMFEKLSDYLSSDDLGGTDFFSSIEISVDDIKVDGEDATASTLITYNVAGEHIEREATFKCVYYNEKWYISSFSLD